MPYDFDLDECDVAATGQTVSQGDNADTLLRKET
jgi:hypothetical protein